MIKKIAVICAAALMLSATGCGQSGEESAEALEQLLSQELTGEITVSCYDTMIYKSPLEAAAKSFEAKNPGTKINIETHAPMPEIKTSEKGGASIAVISKEEDPQGKADYINKINTELMSGGGADVLAMDILPFYKYADRGQLEDLRNYMDADRSFNKSDYRENVIDALRYKDGQYILPMDYRFDYLAYDSSLFTEEEQQKMERGSTFTYDQLVESAEGPFERVNAGSGDPVRMFGLSAYSSRQGSMFREALRQNYDTFIDMENRNVNLTDGRFTSLLEKIGNYADNGYLQPNVDSSEKGEINIDDFKKLKEEQFFYKIKSHVSILFNVLKETTGMNIMVSLRNTSAGNEENDLTLGLPENESGDVNFAYMQAYGINSNSDNKALAWAFVKHLMSKEVQTNMEVIRASLPVNNDARLEKARMEITGASFELTDSQQTALDQYVKTIEGFSDLLNHCPIQDDTINQMINEEVTRYFNGSKTTEEVAETLQKKIELYLNE